MPARDRQESAARGLWLPHPSRLPSWGRLSSTFTPSSLSQFRGLLCQGPPDDRTLATFEDRFNACGIAFIAHRLSADDPDHFHPADHFHPEARSLLSFSGGPTGEAARRMREQYIRAVVELAEDLHCLYDRLTNGASMAVFLHGDRESTLPPRRLPDPRVYITARYVDYTAHSTHILLRGAVQGFVECFSGSISSQLLMAYSNYDTGTQEEFGRTIRAGRPCGMIPSPIGMTNRFIIPIEDSNRWQWAHFPDMITWPPLAHTNGPPSFSNVDPNPPAPSLVSDLMAENRRLQEEKRHLVNEVAALRRIGRIPPSYSPRPYAGDPLVAQRDRLQQQVRRLRSGMRRMTRRLNDLTSDVAVVYISDSNQDASDNDDYYYDDDDDVSVGRPNLNDNAPPGCVSYASYDRLCARLERTSQELRAAIAARQSAEEKWRDAEERWQDAQDYCAELRLELGYE
ncbi:hypothetical protein FISHEDRAFT_76706 [Fistulina hepatica ATCC 64428]|uniref:Uncharacterized protein n=1 Tax=Fistulina hepatica ATCC 64428 TaxID=1128425 RepID=A0A0D7A4N5_9AGAR|nr:hypothetical protein FISHEDRAFT_76706 [Fistulina hepatica ATCC 64428]